LKDVFDKETGQEMLVKFGDKRLGDVMRNYADTSKAKNILSWAVSENLVDGLRKTVLSLNRNNH
jgi:UDP-glucose 4-epimerase